ncbi:glycosyltransferase family 4 protein [Cytophagaceae bacterium 50A-KIRBA]|uniref:glycosyltransferase n=1 Tax=Aquirufa ecclesiirivi TaxID=2715124 RepID=UPI00140D4B67|nr:glycosyltransferase [Aquirufa ecclesiirivi]NHC48153.1 glycosyltransferase family 4 protein [Aquirufa ecclesiirivi]
MKVLIISNFFPPHFIGGYEIACRDTHQLLLDNNIESKVLTSDYYNKDSFINKLIESEKDVLRILKLHSDFKSPKNILDYDFVDRYNEKKISDFVKLYKPDIIYCWNIYGVGTRFLSKININRTIFHIMDLSLFIYEFSFVKWLKSSILSNRNKTTKLARHLKNAIFISNFVSNKFSKYQIRNQTVIYPFLKELPSIYIKKEYSLNDSLYGVYLGQIENHKGIKELCTTLKEINSLYGQNKIQLDIYGASLSGLDNFIKSNFDFVTIFKGLPQEEIFSKLKNYDVGFFPSVWEEPFGIAQIELMAIGVPVFSSGRGGSKEVLNNNNSIEFSDFDHLKNRLIEFINEYPKLGQKIGQNAHREILLRHNSTVYLKQLMIFFQEVIESVYED